MVYFPPGVYLSGTLYLKSNGGLELAPGAVLLASPDREDYNADDFCVQNSFSVKEKASGGHFIVALEQKNIVIRGGGTIDGNRQAFYREPRKDYPRKFKLTEWRPGQMVYFCECENIQVEHVEMNHAPYWTFFLHGCEKVNISGLRIWNDYRTPNGDGIDIDCCRFVTVSDCIIHSGDDCITFRGDNRKLKHKKPCEYVTVANCILGTPCNAFEAGRTPNGVFRRIPLEELKCHPEYLESGLYYDSVCFAKWIRCESYVCTGFTDESCHPGNVYAFYNAIPSGTKKHMSTNPLTGHYGTTSDPCANAKIRELFSFVKVSNHPIDWDHAKFQRKSSSVQTK